MIVVEPSMVRVTPNGVSAVDESESRGDMDSGALQHFLRLFAVAVHFFATECRSLVIAAVAYYLFIKVFVTAPAPPSRRPLAPPQVDSRTLLAPVS